MGSATVEHSAAAPPAQRRRRLEALARRVAAMMDAFLGGLHARGALVPSSPEGRARYSRLSLLQIGLELAISLAELDDEVGSLRRRADAARPSVRWASYAGRLARRLDAEAERVCERREAVRRELAETLARLERLGVPRA